MPRRRTLMRACVGTLCLSLSPLCEHRGFGQQLTVGNAALRRVVSTDGNGWHAASVTNLLTGQELPAALSEFRMVLESWPDRSTRTVLAGSDFRVVRPPKRTDTADGGQSLVLELRHDGHGIDVRIHYDAPAGLPWHRKWLEIAGPESLLLSELDVEVFSVREGVRVENFPGLGQPVYIGRQFFCGVEHPGSSNTVADGVVTCGYRPAMPLSREWHRSKTCVVGVAPDQPCRRVADEFLRYIAHHRPQPLRPFLLWESWMTDTRLNENSCIELATQLKADYSDRGVKLDCFLLSAWWEDMQSIWKPNPEYFPNGLAPVVAGVTQVLDAPTGLWFPLAGGKLDRAWGAHQGYELLRPVGDRPLSGAYCIGGPKYYAEFKRTLVDTVRRHKIAALKMDFVGFRCNQADHGHLPGEDSVVTLMDNYLDVVAAVRAAKPDVVIYPTTGINQSAWWLFHVDAVWRGGSDLYITREPTPAVPHCRALVTTYVDHILYEQFREQRKQYPLSSLMDHGILTAPARSHLGRLGTPDGDPLINFCHDAVLYVLRGSFLRELYVPPASLSEDYKALLAAVLRWSQDPAANEIVLADTRQILGDPDKLEVYGYAHFTDKNRGLVVVRNPSIENQTVELALDERAGMWPSSDRYQIHVLYPYRQVLGSSMGYGGSVSVELDGLEVLVLDVLPVRPGKEWPVGCRLAVADGNEACRYWGQAGTSAETAIGDTRSTVLFPGEARTPQARAGAWRSEGGRAVLDLDVSVPAGSTDPELWLDLRFPSRQAEDDGGTGVPQAEVTVNGEKADVALRMASPWPWCYVQVRLGDAGKHSVRAELSRAAMEPRSASVRALLRYTEQLVPSESLGAQLAPLPSALPELPQRWAGARRHTLVVTPAVDVTLAAGTGAFASSHDGRYPPAAAFDGKPGTFWCSRGGKDEWIAQRFDTERTLSAMEITWFGAWKVKRYRVDIWQDEAWKTVATQENPDSGRARLSTRVTFAAVRTVAVRVVVEEVHAPSVNTAIREIRLLPEAVVGADPPE